MLRLQLVPVLADLGVESVGREVVKSGGRLRRYGSRQELHAYRPRRLAFFCMATGGEKAHNAAPEAAPAQQQAGGGDGYCTAAVQDHIPPSSGLQYGTQADPGRSELCQKTFACHARISDGAHLSGDGSDVDTIVPRTRTGPSITRRRQSIAVPNIRRQRLSERRCISADQQCRLSSSVSVLLTLREIVWHRWNAQAAPCSLWIVPVASESCACCGQTATWLYSSSVGQRSTLFDMEIGRSSRVQQCCFLQVQSHNNDCPMRRVSGDAHRPVLVCRPSATRLLSAVCHLFMLQSACSRAPRCWFSNKRGGGRQFCVPIYRFCEPTAAASTDFVVVPTCQACVDPPELG